MLYALCWKKLKKIRSNYMQSKNKEENNKGQKIIKGREKQWKNINAVKNQVFQK